MPILPSAPVATARIGLWEAAIGTVVRGREALERWSIVALKAAVKVEESLTPGAFAYGKLILTHQAIRQACQRSKKGSDCQSSFFKFL
jgi:hypothetical protein